MIEYQYRRVGFKHWFMDPTPLMCAFKNFFFVSVYTTIVVEIMLQFSTSVSLPMGVKMENSLQFKQWEKLKKNYGKMGNFYSK